MASDELTAQFDPYREMENYLEKVAEELDEVFNQLSKKPEKQPNKLATNSWPPNRKDVDESTARAQNGGDYLAGDFGGRFDDVILEFQLPERIVCQACTEGTDNMRYHVSPTKRKRCRSRSSDQSNLQLPGFYDDKSAVLLNVKVINAPPAPVRQSSLNRFQMIIAQQQKQFDRQESNGGGPLEVATQTSPTCSRSSSFTWLSDRSDTGNCSSAEEEAVTPCSSTDDSVTDHHISCGSSTESSVTPPGRSDEPESGIGTASPPHHRYSKSGNQKCRRKETWERLQKRHADRRATVKHAEPAAWAPATIAVDAAATADTVEPERHQTAQDRPVRPNRLPLTSECRPEKIGYELPSPTAVSLNGGDVPPELQACKSSSAPHLVKSTQTLPRTEFGGSEDWKQQRYHSERYLAEIEAKEACKWLRAAGFPQYAQMYEDLQFPIDVNGVQKDHPFLDLDSLQSLFRRLHALNRCANMKLDFSPKHAIDDSDSEGECALSENWTFQRESRRWSRVDDIVNAAMMLQAPDQNLQASADQQQNAQQNPQQQLQPPAVGGGGGGDGTCKSAGVDPPQSAVMSPAAVDASEALASRFRRSGSERLRDGAKAILRRVESLKTRRRKQRNRDGVVIGSPQIIDVASMQQRMKELNCVDVTPPDSPITDDHIIKSKRYLAKPESLDSLAYSDSELSWRNEYTDANSNNTKPLLEFIAFDGGNNDFNNSSPNGSQDSRTYKNKDNDSIDSVSSAVQDSDQELTVKSKGSVVRWHSFQKTKNRPDSMAGQQAVGSLTVGQLLVLRKLALLKLTAIMERYCPTHRTGWNWELPKFMRKTKMPDPKDKTVFGVPLITNVQKNGTALPPFIQSAFRWLEDNALDHVGLFRKPGVKSRIQRLKQLAEADPDNLNFENHHTTYDIADMVKQYFRELPEALLTNKLSESFIAIFQHVPVHLQKEAVHCTVLLLPDEHREALFTLLDFLSRVSSRSHVNQMSASNLAVCLAPSLFHMGNGSWAHGGGGGGGGSGGAGSTPPSPVTAQRSSSVSPRRNQPSTIGLPDSKQLSQNKAAHDCLLYLIKQYRQLFVMSEDIMSQCHFSYMDESIPISLEELGAEMGHDWRGYLNVCTSALLKEVKDKNRGWIAAGSFENVDMSYKKVGDGHPLRLWRVCTEVEAPPTEVLTRILWERHVWDKELVSARVVMKMDAQAELYQYTNAAMEPHLTKDYCVVRSWRTDLNKGGCAVVETSVEHADARLPEGAVRGIVLASRYLIEPCGSGKSRVLHLSRVDTKGRTCEWYNKIFGYITSKYLSRIRKSFEHSAEGPESKV